MHLTPAHGCLYICRKIMVPFSCYLLNTKCKLSKHIWIFWKMDLNQKPPQVWLITPDSKSLTRTRLRLSCCPPSKLSSHRAEVVHVRDTDPLQPILWRPTVTRFWSHRDKQTVHFSSSLTQVKKNYPQVLWRAYNVVLNRQFHSSSLKGASAWTHSYSWKASNKCAFNPTDIRWGFGLIIKHAQKHPHWI